MSRGKSPYDNDQKKKAEELLKLWLWSTPNNRAGSGRFCKTSRKEGNSKVALEIDVRLSVIRRTLKKKTGVDFDDRFIRNKINRIGSRRGKRNFRTGAPPQKTRVSLSSYRYRSYEAPKNTDATKELMLELAFGTNISLHELFEKWRSFSKFKRSELLSMFPEFATTRSTCYKQLNTHCSRLNLALPQKIKSSGKGLPYLFSVQLHQIILNRLWLPEEDLNFDNDCRRLRVLLLARETKTGYLFARIVDILKTNEYPITLDMATLYTYCFALVQEPEKGYGVPDSVRLNTEPLRDFIVDVQNKLGGPIQKVTFSPTIAYARFIPDLWYLVGNSCRLIGRTAPVIQYFNPHYKEATISDEFLGILEEFLDSYNSTPDSVLDQEDDNPKNRLAALIAEQDMYISEAQPPAPAPESKQVSARKQRNIDRGHEVIARVQASALSWDSNLVLPKYDSQGYVRVLDENKKINGTRIYEDKEAYIRAVYKIEPSPGPPDDLGLAPWFCRQNIRQPSTTTSSTGPSELMRMLDEMFPGVDTSEKSDGQPTNGA